MSKWSKRLLGLAAIGGAAAGLAYYLTKSDSYDMDDFDDEFEEDDFDLDSDLKPVTDREYVPLNNASKAEDPQEEETKAEDTLANAAETIKAEVTSGESEAAEVAEAVEDTIDDLKKELADE